MKHVEHAMGTVFSFDIRDDCPPDALAAAVDWLHRVDATFSTYQEDSQISRLGRSELRIEQCDPEVREVLEACARLGRETDGWFSAMPSGRLDPSGYVKGWSVERASELLRAAGSAHHAVNGGGDIRLAGGPWRIGIADPLRPGRLAAVVSGSDIAIATSGTAERGAHVVDPFTGAPASGLASVTIVGRDLGDVDAYATAAVAMGAGAVRWLEEHAATDGIQALVIQEDGTRWATEGWSAYDAMPSDDRARTRP